MPVIDGLKLVEERAAAIKNAHKSAGILRGEADISGGVDSFVIAGLVSIAIGAENVTLAHLGFNTDPAATNRAIRAAEAFGCKLIVSDFTDEYNSIINKMKRDMYIAGYDLSTIDARIEHDNTILGSIRSTLRAPLGRGYNRLTGGGLRHGTGNECEDRFLRFYQKGGDGEVDSNPIAMLSKNEVWQLAHAIGNYFGTTRAIDAAFETIAAVPSSDLWGIGAAHNDEDELLRATGAPFNYGKIDAATGKVLRIGSIERVSRFLDMDDNLDILNFGSSVSTWGEALFSDIELGPNDMYIMATASMEYGTKPFGDCRYQLVTSILSAARKYEKITRHKLNPNIPMYGSRANLVSQNIITNDFSAYKVI